MNKTKQIISGIVLGCVMAAFLMLPTFIQAQNVAIGQGGNTYYQPAIWLNTVGASNDIVGSTAWNAPTPPRLDISSVKDVALEFHFRLTGAGTAPVAFGIGRNLSGNIDGTASTNIETGWAFSFAPNGATFVTFVTNLWTLPPLNSVTAQAGAQTNLVDQPSICGVPYLYLQYITNSGAGTVHLTNITIRAFGK